MKRQELIKLLTFMGDIYRQFEFPKETEAKSKRFVENWAEFVLEYDYEDARLALEKYCEKNPKWPPNAPELSNKIESIVDRRQRMEWAKKQQERIEKGEVPQRLPGGDEDGSNRWYFPLPSGFANRYPANSSPAAKLSEIAAASSSGSSVVPSISISAWPTISAPLLNPKSDRSLPSTWATLPSKSSMASSKVVPSPYIKSPVLS